MIGRRILVQQRRQVHDLSSIKSFVPIKGPNLGSDPTNHKILKDRSHCLYGQSIILSQVSKRERIEVSWFWRMRYGFCMVHYTKCEVFYQIGNGGQLGFWSFELSLRWRRGGFQIRCLVFKWERKLKQ